MQHFYSDFEFASLLGGLAVYIILSVLWYHIEFLVSALSSSVYPDAGPVWSLPLHGSVFLQGIQVLWRSARQRLHSVSSPSLTRRAALPWEPEVSSEELFLVLLLKLFDIPWTLDKIQSCWHEGTETLPGWPDSAPWFQSFVSFIRQSSDMC